MRDTCRVCAVVGGGALRAARKAALAGTFCVLAAAAASARAGSWGSDSSIGVSSEYSSNPYLLTSYAQSAESVALLLNLPVTYTGDAGSLDLIPRFRVAETYGSLALLSNYQYLDGLWKLNGERNALTASAEWHHDSTLYNQFENAALDGRSVHRMEETAALDWQRQLSARSDFQLQGSFDHVAYDRNAAQTVVNFNYSQLSAQYDRSLSERWQGSFVAGAGRYELLDHSYRSNTGYAQIGINRALSERWTLSAQVGYSRLDTQSQVPQDFLVIIPSGNLEVVQELVRVKATGGTGSFAATLRRRYERLVLGFAASRAVQPSGFGALLTQDDASLTASYDWNERWNVGATLHGSHLSDALHQRQLGNRRYYDLDLSTSWRWTEHWTVQLQASGNWQRVDPDLNASNATVFLTFTRQLGRVRLR